MLNELISKHKLREDEKRQLFAATSSSATTTSSAAESNLKSFLATESKKLDLPDVNVFLEILTQRKTLLEAESVAAENRLVYEFLQRLLKQTEQQKEQLQKKLKLIKSDLGVVDNILKSVQNNCPKLEDVDKNFQDKESEESNDLKKEMMQLITSIGQTADPKSSGTSANPEKPEGFNSSKPDSNETISSYTLRKQKIFAHFDDIVKCYYSTKTSELQFIDQENAPQSTVPAQESATPTIPKSLETFRENLVNFSRFTRLRTLSTLNYTNETNGLSTIVSSIEFDSSCDLFAIAGVSKRIKIFDYLTAIRDANVDLKYPINEMLCTSKISCLSWNFYFKELLASSDYEGIITVWDVETRTRKRSFQEHDKRSWSVDFNEIDSKLLASGSDDSRVKLWSLDCEHSVGFYCHNAIKNLSDLMNFFHRFQHSRSRRMCAVSSSIHGAVVI